VEPRRVKIGTYFCCGVLALALSACSNDDAENQATLKPAAAKPAVSKDAVIVSAEKPLGTPMAERTAVLGLLNKRNGEARDLELKPGQYIRMGKVEVRLRACERTAPWETYADHGAFVQLVLFERPAGTTQSPRWSQVFSGWLFKENPAANVVQHPIYDVWVKECKMSFPGEEEAAAPSAAAGSAPSPAAKKPSNAPQSAPVQPGAGGEEDSEEPAVEEQTVETT
jgi:hypothetical protein